MSQWLDIPAHRVLMVSKGEFTERYVRLDANGQPAVRGAIAELIRRDDGRLFRFAPYWPADHDEQGKLALVEA